MPGVAVGADFERRDRYIGINDLHCEPILRRTILIVEDNRAGDTACDNRPGHGDNTSGGVIELGECVREQVQMVLATAWAFIENLL